MKVYSLSKQETVVNNNGNISRESKTIQHDGKKGVIKKIKNGRVTIKKFKLKKNNKRNNKNMDLFMPMVLSQKRNNSAGLVKKMKKRKVVTKKKKTKKRKQQKRRKTRKKTKKGFWEKIFF